MALVAASVLRGDGGGGGALLQASRTRVLAEVPSVFTKLGCSLLQRIKVFLVFFTVHTGELVS